MPKLAWSNPNFIDKQGYKLYDYWYTHGFTIYRYKDQKLIIQITNYSNRGKKWEAVYEPFASMYAD